MATNVVLAGDLEGGEIKLSSGGKCAYVIKGTKTKYINKLDAEKVTEVNRSTVNNVGDAMIGEALLGNSGILLGANQKEILLEIYWKDGKTSLVKVDNTVHQAMIVGMYKEVTQTQQLLIEQKDTSTRETSSIIGIIIFVIAVIVYVIPVMTS